MFYEVTWSVDVFKDQWYGPNHPFVFSQGDPTGYGFHGDFVSSGSPHIQAPRSDKDTDSG